NIHHELAGAYTGEVSAPMVASLATWTIVGHSERRRDAAETDELIGRKVGRAREAGLRVILCVGERLDERESGRASEDVAAQLRGCLGNLDAEDLADVAEDKLPWLTIAYEPVWAIGTGRNAQGRDAAAMAGLLGESDWNRENRFTGWTDVDLSSIGQTEAHEAARLLAADGFVFDLAYTSVLKRAIRTLWIVLDDLDLMWLPVHNSWRLNERHYGALQGLNKSETAARFGEEQVKVWRRSYDTPPPPLEPDDERHPRFDPRYAGLAAA